MQRTNQAATADAAPPATLTDGTYAGAEMDRAGGAGFDAGTAPSAAPPDGTDVVTLNNNQYAPSLKAASADAFLGSRCALSRLVSEALRRGEDVQT